MTKEEFEEDPLALLYAFRKIIPATGDLTSIRVVILDFGIGVITECKNLKEFYEALKD